MGEEGVGTGTQERSWPEETGGPGPQPPQVT